MGHTFDLIFYVNRLILISVLVFLRVLWGWEGHGYPTAHKLISEDISWALLLLFQHVGSWELAQNIRLEHRRPASKWGTGITSNSAVGYFPSVWGWVGFRVRAFAWHLQE